MKATADSPAAQRCRGRSGEGGPGGFEGSSELSSGQSAAGARPPWMESRWVQMFCTTVRSTLSQRLCFLKSYLISFST